MQALSAQSKSLSIVDCDDSGEEGHAAEAMQHVSRVTIGCPNKCNACSQLEEFVQQQQILVCRVRWRSPMPQSAPDSFTSNVVSAFRGRRRGSSCSCCPGRISRGTTRFRISSSTSQFLYSIILCKFLKFIFPPSKTFPYALNRVQLRIEPSKPEESEAKFAIFTA